MRNILGFMTLGGVCAALAGCVPTPEPGPPDTSVAEAACLQAVGQSTGDPGVSVNRADVGDANVVVFVDVPSTGGIWSCDAGLDGTVFATQDAAIRL